MEFFSCTYENCKESFVTKSLLKDHLTSHQETCFKCPICVKAFLNKATLLKHKRVHDQLKPHKCTIDGCSQTFAQSSNLKRH